MGLSVLLACTLAPVLVGQTAATPPAVKVIATFEDMKDIDLERGLWRSNTGGGISREHATDGQQTLWSSFSRDNAVLMSTAGALPEDWTGYEKFWVDAFVQGAPVILTITLNDHSSQSYRVPHYYVRTGANTIEVDLAGAGKVVDLAHMVGLKFVSERSPEGQNTTYFDNIRLVRGMPPVIPTDLASMAEIPVVAGNLVANGGFEYGLQNWQFWGKFDWGNYQAGTAPAGDAHTGTSCATIKSVGFLPGRGGLATDRIWVGRRGTYQVKFFVKGTPDSVFRFGMANARARDTGVDVPLTPEWREFTYDASPMDERRPVRLWFYNVGNGTVFVDDVSFTPVGATLQAANETILQGKAEVRLTGTVMYVNGEPFYPRGIIGCEAPDTDLAGTPVDVAVAPVVFGNPRPFLDRCTKAGIFAIANISEAVTAHVPTALGGPAKAVEKHSAVIGYLLADEPDGESHPVAPGEIRLAEQTLRKVDTSLPAVLRLEVGAPSSLYQFGDIIQVLMVSAFPVRTARPFDLTEVTNPIDRAKAYLHGKAPIWVVLDLKGGGSVEVQADELSAMTYVAVAHGADGVFWEPFSSIQETPALWEAVKSTADELRQLTPALISPVVSVITGAKWKTMATESKASMHGTSRRYQDQLYLIIVNISAEAQPGTTFTLANVPPTAPVEVLFENRTLTVEKSVLTDDFGPYARHVYRLTVPPEAPAAPAAEAPTAPTSPQPPTPAPPATGAPTPAAPEAPAPAPPATEAPAPTAPEPATPAAPEPPAPAAPATEAPPATAPEPATPAAP